MDDLALRAGALVLFVAIMAGGVYAAEQAFQPDIAIPGGAALALGSPEPAKLAQAGHTVTFPLIVTNQGNDLQQVHLASGGGPFQVAVVPNDFDLAPRASRGVFATATIPPGQAEGASRMVLQALLHGKAAATLPLTLTVARAAEPAEQGEQVTLDYVGRFPNGTLFDTSVRLVGEGPFDQQPARRQYQPLSVVLGPEAGTIQGFWRGLVGLGAGQSRTFQLTPEEAYGEATVSQDVPRTNDIPRLSRAEPRVQNYPRTILTNYLNSSSQVGDVVHIEDPSGNDRAYRITALDDVNASLLWDIREGDPHTMYPLWPGQAYATEVTDTTVRFRLEPRDVNQTLTFYQFWPSMSRIRSMNETTVLLEHSPPVGYDFTVQTQQGVIQGRVAAVEADRIVVERPNDHPLAGQTLIFDVTVREVAPVFQAP